MKTRYLAFYTTALNHGTAQFKLSEYSNVRGATMGKIKGNNDGPGGRNDTYQIGNRPAVPRKDAVKEVEAGKHPGNHTVEIDGQKYVRDNPDKSKKDNVNR
jgi:hypothetical protein